MSLNPYFTFILHITRTEWEGREEAERRLMGLAFIQNENLIRALKCGREIERK